MKRIYYKSDFTLRLQWTRCDHVPLNLEGVDWSAKFFTHTTVNAFEASCIGGEYRNCRREADGSLTVVFDRHRLSPGKLEMELHVRVPDPDFADGVRDVRDRTELGVTLTPCQGDCIDAAEIEIIAPFIKGEPFTFDDFTPEQIEDLQRPATEAADSVLKLEKNVDVAEKKRIADEQSRQEAEQARIRAEETRVSDESIRQENEQERRKAETERQDAETARAEEFATWEDELDSKADRSELSNVLAEESLTPDNFPDVNTYTREELKKDLFVDMWNMKCIKPEYGRYDPVGAPDSKHPFFLNKLWLTYEEALAVDRFSTVAVLTEANAATSFGVGRQQCRTLYPMLTMPSASMYQLTQYSRIETIRILPYYDTYFHCADLRGSFVGNYLEEILGIFNFPQVNNANYTIYDWIGPRLKEFSGAKLKCSINVSASRYLNLHTFRFMVENAVNTSAITITVHPDVYSKLTDETNTEWHAILAQAAEKNISFATT